MTTQIEAAAQWIRGFWLNLSCSARHHAQLFRTQRGMRGRRSTQWDPSVYLTDRFWATFPFYLTRCDFCADNAYRLGAVRAVGHLCKTNMFSNTAFRGFGGPQVLLLPPPPASPCSV